MCEPPFTEALRTRLSRALSYETCAACGTLLRRSFRADASRVGIGVSTLHRFLISGRGVSVANVDAIVAFCEAAEAAKEKQG